MPETKCIAIEDAAADVSFEPYGRLFRMLMPSLGGILVHDGLSNLVWASDEWDPADEPDAIKKAIANAVADPAGFAGAVETLDADRAVYCFAIREHVELLGVLSLIARLSGKQTEARPLQTVLQLVQPALECLRRELTLRSKLRSRERDLGVRERDLDLMLEISSHAPPGASDSDEFGLIMKTGLERMSCALAALWVPDKNISLSLTRSGHPMPPELLQRAQRHLTAWMQLQQRTIVVNHISKAASDLAAPYKILACPVRHASERVMGVLALFNPPDAPDFDPQQARITEALAKRAGNIIQAQYDCSTGLMTRQAFERQAAALLGPATAANAHTILYLDIDRLHVINEAFGMHVGDDVIRNVAQCLVKSLSARTLSARISGDRLAALIPDANLDEAAIVAEKIRAAAAAIVPREGQGAFEVSACLGVASIGRSQNPLAHALATAEIACKTAKEHGRNRVEICRDPDQRGIRRQTDAMVIGKLRDALGNDRFRLDAQPILPLRGNYGRPRFELLIRMLGDHGEIIAPGKFLTAAERYQLMPAVDRWVVQRACKLLGEQRGSVGKDMARFAVNLSGQSLRDAAFLEFVTAQIKAARLEPAVFCFELTESATIGSLPEAQNFIRSLKDLGCQFALDDFGTGTSALAYLKNLSVDYLKIDGTFVRDAVTNPRSESMIKAIAQLAKVMCMETIAEHVETDALRGRIAGLGVDYGQGFAVGKAHRLEDLLQELAIYEATVDDWAMSPESSCEPMQSCGAMSYG